MIDIFYSRQACNTYVMYNENNEGFLVDPGYNKNNVLIDHLKKIGVNIKAILITHGHFDHISALKDVLELYPEAKVYINDDEKEFLTNTSLNLSCEDIDWLDKEISFMPEKLQTFVDNENIEILGFKIQCMHTPFHTKGSSCYFVTNENILFSGDTLFYTTIGRTDLPTGSSRTIETSLSKIKNLPDETKVYPGHGVITSLNREKKYNHYLRNI